MANHLLEVYKKSNSAFDITTPNGVPSDTLVYVFGEDYDVPPNSRLFVRWDVVIQPNAYYIIYLLAQSVSGLLVEPKRLTGLSERDKGFWLRNDTPHELSARRGVTKLRLKLRVNIFSYFQKLINGSVTKNNIF